MARAVRPTLIALVVLAGLVSCDFRTPAGPSPTSLPQLPPWSGRLSTSAIDLATHSGSWPKSQQLVDAAINTLIRQCLQENGFDYPPLKASSYTAPEDEAAVIDLPERKMVGYGTSSSTSSQQPVDKFYNHLPTAEQHRFDTVFFGHEEKKKYAGTYGLGPVKVPTDGCIAGSRRALAGDVVLWARLDYAPEDIDDRLGKELRSAPEYLTALKIWRSCMADRHHPFSSPEQAEASVTGVKRAGGTVASKRLEILVAVTDGECAVRAHLPKAELIARRRLVYQLPLQDKKFLAWLAAKRDAVVSRARMVLKLNR
ncbi:hypothetical protein ABZ770_29900 [Streptomyces sp. NPDC006654]|uniref:hypothetical protein n=1 Tax=Streptomyces sp. NPDC006654 TaxID=3156897 RepID=UPI0033D9608A